MNEESRKIVRAGAKAREWLQAELEELRRESLRASRELDRLQRELEEARSVVLKVKIP